MVKCSKFRGRQGIFMCLAAPLCQKIPQFANGGAKIPTHWCKDYSHWRTLVGSMLYLNVKITTHEVPFANTNTRPVNMARCKNVCIRSYFSRFFEKDKVLVKVKSVNMSTFILLVRKKHLLRGRGVCTQANICGSLILLPNIIHAKSWLKITW